MTNSYEEIRTAAIDVLAGRVVPPYPVNQYAHFKIGVAKALEERQGIQHHGFGDRTLTGAAADTFLEVFWDLFRQGIITLGNDDANPVFPFFRISTLGQRMLSNEDSYFVHDVSAYESRIRKEVPMIDDPTLVYLKEAVQAFRSGCILSATVMLGVATEHTFQLLLESIEQNAKRQQLVETVSRERSILRRVNKFWNLIEPETKSFPPELREDLETRFLGILSIIRQFRNDSGHPTGKIIDREQAFVLLQLFIPYCKKMHQLRDYLKQ
jgi:hypothetical protein